jgi:hypothetical protein
MKNTTESKINITLYSIFTVGFLALTIIRYNNENSWSFPNYLNFLSSVLFLGSTILAVKTLKIKKEINLMEEILTDRNKPKVKVTYTDKIDNNEKSQ